MVHAAPSILAVPTTPTRSKRASEVETPRRRKEPSSLALRGLRSNQKESIAAVRNKVTKKLKLEFEMDDWQVHLIHKIRMGYDSILLAGTGYGKSLIFQGLAVMDPMSIVIVISPLKALERDQVLEAEAKGIRAAMINENTACSNLWARLRQGKDHLYYVSPEMILGNSFSEGDTQIMKKGKAVALELKGYREKREKIEKPLENLINLQHIDSQSTKSNCIHNFFRQHFRPKTQLNTFTSLDPDPFHPDQKGSRSLASNFQLSWTTLTMLDWQAPLNNCCNFCNKSLNDLYQAPGADDARLTAYASDFTFPLVVASATDATQNPRGRAHAFSITSHTSTESEPQAIAVPMSQVAFKPLKQRCTLPDSQKKNLHTQLEAWRDQQNPAVQPELEGFALFSSRLVMPDKVIKRLVDYGGHFLRHVEVTPELIHKVAQWDLATDSSLRQVVNIICCWRQQAVLELTPGGRGGQKKRLKRSGADPTSSC
ncbi:hypothetical protein CVT24_006896 [Panaeolus cyanescens]|uniref:DNA 3'-5' helicase n=1 Tax=Panaeolus cyanescens TaxID=181874 RepID=A0A409YNW4_9AGAR|nr:hypothetical protein CVT24_006896 [Panaeolus cyanescens]